MLVANLSVPLLGVVDTAILGHLDDAIYLGSAALGAQIITSLFWAFGFLRMGTTGLTARAFGEHSHNKNSDKLNTVLQQSIVFALALSVIIFATHWLSLPLIVNIVSGSDHLLPQTDGTATLSSLVLDYTNIRIYSAPATLCTYALVGWLIGIQRTHYAMYVLVLTNLTNIGLDYLFIIDMGMNTAGAALASLIAEYLGFLVALALVLNALKGFGPRRLAPKLFNFSAYSEMLLSSQHLFIRTLLLLFVFLFFASQGARLGETTLASNAILLSLLALTAYFMDGFAYSAETLCGEAWGKKDYALFREACIKTTILAFGVAALSSLTFLLGADWIISIYTNIPSIFDSAKHDITWLALLPMVAIWCYQLDGIFIGIGETKAMRDNMFIATIFIYLPCWYLTRHLENTGLWIAFFSFFIVRALTMARTYRLMHKNLEFESTK